MHPSGSIRGASSGLLAGRRIALAVTGSIAAVEAVKLARELARHGAEVRAVMSRAATELVHPNALEWATGHAPVTRLTGQVEHLWAVNGEVDLVLVAPATANTIAKVALAIDDTPVTSLASTSIGHAPVVVAPAMHEGMYDNPVTAEHIAALAARGVRFVKPVLAEDEAKLAPIPTIVEHVIAALGPGTLAGKRVLVVNGSTIEPMDEMRVITNKSTGRTGAALAVEAFRLGADVTMWFGHGHCTVPEHFPVERFVSVDDLVEMVPRAREFDWVLVPAAISDFRGKEAKGKLSSKGGHTLELTPTEKVLPHLRKALGRDGQRLVAFKAEASITEDELLEKAERARKEAGSDAVIANLLNDVGVDATRVHIVLEGGTERVEGSKREVARVVLERLAAKL